MPLTGSLPLAERDESVVGLLFVVSEAKDCRKKTVQEARVNFFPRWERPRPPGAKQPGEPSDFRGGRWWDATWDLRGQIPDPSALPSAGTKLFA